jgi:hypothetical protein
MSDDPEAIADAIMRADPLDTLKEANALFRTKGDPDNRKLGALIALEAAVLQFHSNGATRAELAPLIALSGALRDHQYGVRSDLLAVKPTGGRPHEGRSTPDDVRAVSFAAVEHLVSLGASVKDAERSVGRAVGVNATRVHTWRKDSARHKASLIYRLFATECADMKASDTLTAVKDFMARQP